MTNVNLFKSAMVLMGYTQKSLAEALGISKASLFLKIHNEREFRSSEIVALKKLLNLTPEQRDEIFFAECVDK